MVVDSSHSPASKGKRQRRSYSCGPCKLLKIKCDLSLPCSSCVKLKRIEKCKASPPNPPSSEELRIIEERKNRLNKRNQKQPKPDDKDSSNKSGSSTASPQTETSCSHSSNEHNWHEVIQQHLSHADDFTTLQSNSVDVDSIPVLASHKLSNEKSLFRDDLVEYFGRMIALSADEIAVLKNYLPTADEAALLFEQYLKVENTDKFEIIDFSFILKFSFPLIQYIHSIPDGVGVELNAAGCRILTYVLPMLAIGLLVSPELQVRNHKNEDVIKVYIELSRTMKNNTHDHASFLGVICYIIWYLINETYFTMSNHVQENYFEYTNLLSTLLFNERCMKCIVEQDLQENASEVEQKEFSVVAKFWFRLRIVELDITYFQYKSSLMNSNTRFRNSIAPTTKWLDIVYGEDRMGVKFELQRFAFHVTEHYFNQIKEANGADPDIEVVKKLNTYRNNTFDLKGDLKRARVDPLVLMKKYLTIYSGSHSAIRKDVDQMQRRLSDPSYSRSFSNLVSRENLVLYMENQTVFMIFTKWLTFVKVESSYFPSLRYCTYLTSVLAMFNHFNQLDELIVSATNGRSNILNELTNAFNYYHFKGVISSFMFSQFFLMIMKNFTSVTDTDQNSCALDMNRFFETVNYNFNHTFQKLLNYFSKSPLNNIPIYKYNMNLVYQMNFIFNNVMTFNSNMNINQFVNLLMANMPQDQFNLFVEYHFGSKTTLMGYLDCVWELFKFLICTPRSQRIPMLSTVDFTSDLILSYQHSLMGFPIDSDVVDDYINVVVKPGVT